MPFNFDATRSIEGVRLGHVPAWFEDEGASDVDRVALQAARCVGAEVVEVSLPDLPYGSLMNILFTEAAASFEELTLSGRDDELAGRRRMPGPMPFARRAYFRQLTMFRSTACAIE